VRTINLAGEPLTSALADAIYAKTLVERVYDLYGPSEDTTYSTYALRSLGGPATIGRPIANTRTYILDRSLSPVPIGVPGELYIGGAGLARGYLNRPELTAEKFVPDPFSQMEGERLYRTGDLCRYLPDGNIEFLGRLDHQVKIRGFRIELGEIESVLLDHSSVREAVVVAREDGSDQKRLVAYVAGDEGAIDIPVLREHLRSKLPEYMVPSAFMVLESLPLSSNGKIDRKALPAPDASSIIGSQSGEYSAPRTPVEEALCEIWREVLHREQVGIHDNFFELGGHSLLATQVISRIRKTFDVELPLRALFEHPTVAALAMQLQLLSRAGAAKRLPPINRAERNGPLPLSVAQQRLWFIDRLHEDGSTYNLQCALRLRGPLDVRALDRSFAALVDRHESLRTNIVEIDGVPMQVIHEKRDTPLSVIDISGVDSDDQKDRVRSLCATEASTPFDLTAGSLIRGSLVRISDDDHYLLITMHHIVSDGWSTGVLVHDIGALYTAFRQGLPSPLPDLEIQYADYAVWQRECLQGGSLAAHTTYWTSQLAGMPPALNLPTDRPPHLAATNRGAYEWKVIDSDLTSQIRALCRDEAASQFMVLLAAFSVLLHERTGLDDIVVGTDEAGRHDRALEPLIGFFINHLVLRSDLGGDPTFLELVRRVRGMTLDAYAHQEMPFDKLVEITQPDRSTATTPLFQVLVVMNTPPAELTFDETVDVQRANAGMTSSKYDICLFLSDRKSDLVATWVYRTDLFNASTIQAMAADFDAILRSVAGNPELKLAELRSTLRELACERNEARRNERRMINRTRLKSGSIH
jgi:acyl carrier protein